MTTFLERLTLALSIIFPIVFWHTHLPRDFQWFVQNDFLTLNAPWISTLVFCLFALSSMLLCITYFKNRPHSAAIGIIISTALSWNIGIVYLNSDFSFTLTNVLTHGIPYLAIIWISARKNLGNLSQRVGRFFFQGSFGFICLMSFLILAGMFEEYLWDLFTNGVSRRSLNDHFSIELPSELISMIVGILAVPQMTHYILDGIIWKTKFSKQLDQIAEPEHWEEFNFTSNRRIHLEKKPKFN